jgi:hypothetical protein
MLRILAWILGARRPSHIDIGRGPVPADIKELSILDLERLSSVAKKAPWSANGRPRWVHDSRKDVSRILLTVFGVESESVYRCVAVVFTGARSAHSFTVDVGFDDFNSLPSLSKQALSELNHSLLYNFPMVPLDPEQEKNWEALERDTTLDENRDLDG